MARTQEFDTAKALCDARAVFWDKGFESTTISDLEVATGLGRSSIYHGFESKRGLFDAVINDYMDTVLRPRLELLTHQEALGGGIDGYLASLAESLKDAAETAGGRGCLLLNTAAGIAGTDATLQLLISGYQLELRHCVGLALKTTDPGQTDSRVAARSRIVAGLIMSALLLARINLEEAVATLGAARAQVRDWDGSIQPQRAKRPL
ncbi:TetR/AcrR family transcriptional regulator [Paeniglutamicibacter antarcticus]|uniref:HTH tetR-type domain-containing protein n=1 Tax=Paeniglutamicibacter antarcticus TaxID=494023 RepID=A0ABP9TK51_9MICC